MLIRSQNREVLINFNASAGIDIEEGPVKTTMTSYITGARYLLGKYSNKRKAMKVLDMFQKADETSVQSVQAARMDCKFPAGKGYCLSC